MATARLGRTGRTGRAPARAGRVMAHRARRQLAPSPDAIAERVAGHVGAVFQRWAERFLRLVMADLVPFRFKQDATLRGLFEEAGHADPERRLLEEAFRGLDNQSADEVRVAGVRTADVVPGGPALQQRWIRQNTDLIKAESDLRRRVERIISDPLNEGRSVADISKLLQEQAGYSKSRAELTARDQTLKMYGQIQQERQSAAGITQYIWTTSLDERVREDHAALDGTTQSWDDPPIVDQRTGRRGHPGSDFQCLPGHSQIGFTSPVHRAFRRWHCGQLTTLVTDAGETLECTPNHPVLTTSGWKPAHAVQVGDHVVQARLDCSVLPEADVQYGQSRVAEVFEALALTFGICRPSAVAPQFHGDMVVDQQVDVVDVDRRLRSDIETAFRERLCEFEFTYTDAPALGTRQALQVLDRLGLTAYSGVSGIGKCLALFLGRVREARNVGGASAAWLHALTDQEGADGLARQPESLGEAFDRGTIPLQLQAFIVREWLGIVRRTVNVPAAVDRDDLLPERLLMNADLACDAGPGLALRTQFTRVVDNFSSDFSGHVYNLSTANNWYVAQRLIVHNCRCTAVPILPEFDDDGAPVEPAPRAVEPAPPEPVMQPTQADLDLVRRQADAEARRAQLEAAADRRIAAARAEVERIARAQAEADRLARIEQDRQAAEVRAAAEARLLAARAPEPAMTSSAANRVLKQAARTVYVAPDVTTAAKIAVADGIARAAAVPLHPDVPRLNIRVVQNLNGTTANGEYDTGTRDLTVAASRTAEQIAPHVRPLGAQDHWSMSYVSKDPAVALRNTTMHEYAHHIHLSVGTSTRPEFRAVDRRIKRAYAEIVGVPEPGVKAHSQPAGRAPTKYARTDPDEMWAESFTMYQHDASWMRLNKPEAYQLVVDVLALLAP